MKSWGKARAESRGADCRGHGCTPSKEQKQDWPARFLGNKPALKRTVLPRVCLQLEVCKEQVEWATQEKRTFLRQVCSAGPRNKVGVCGGCFVCVRVAARR